MGCQNEGRATALRAPLPLALQTHAAAGPYGQHGGRWTALFQPREPTHYLPKANQQMLIGNQDGGQKRGAFQCCVLHLHKGLVAYYRMNKFVSVRGRSIAMTLGNMKKVGIKLMAPILAKNFDNFSAVPRGHNLIFCKVNFFIFAHLVSSSLYRVTLPTTVRIARRDLFSNNLPARISNA